MSESILSQLKNKPKPATQQENKILVKLENDNLLVTREIDGGLQTLKLTMPSIITTDLRLNEPRYASLPNIMKAKRKPIDEMKVEELNIDIEPRLEILKVEEPKSREAGIMVKSVDEMIEKLKNEAKVI